MKAARLFLVLILILTPVTAVASFLGGDVSASGVSKAMGWDLDLAQDYGDSFGDGSGDSAANAIDIDSVGALLKLAGDVDNHDKYFKMSKDIDFYGLEMTPIATFVQGDFSGTFNGNGFTIRNMVIDDTDTRNQTALFNGTAAGAAITNLTIEDSKVIGSDTTAGLSQYTAIFVAESNSDIARCYSINNVVETVHSQDGSGYAGHIAGANHGNIEHCASSGWVRGEVTVSLSDYLALGGIVGYQTGISGGDLEHVQDCVSTVRVGHIIGESEGLIYAGGIAGNCSSLGEINRCQHYGPINYKTADIAYIGGVLGRNQGVNITDSCHVGLIQYETTVATGSSYVGGITGQNATAGVIDRCYSDSDFRVGDGTSTVYIGGLTGFINAATVTDSYSHGTFYDLTADSTTLTWAYAGGFCGRGDGAYVLTNCYASMGPWAGQATTRNGFLGFDNSSTETVTACFWDTDVAGWTTADPVATAATAEELMTETTFTGWDFTNFPRDWRMADGFDYPRLDWE